MSHTVVTYAKRTAIGKFMGSLSSLSATDMGAKLVAHAISSLNLDTTSVDEIIMGQVLAAGSGQAPARQAAIKGGLPNSVCASTINRVCGSSLKAVMLADQSIRLGESRIVLRVVKNLSRAPHLLMDSRSGQKFGSMELKDHMQFDGLWDLQ